LFCEEDGIALKKADEPVVLSAACIVLLAEVKKHFLQFVKSLCKKQASIASPFFPPVF